MEAKKAATDVLAAVQVLEHARKACVNLKSLDAPMSEDESQWRDSCAARLAGSTKIDNANRMRYLF